MWCEKFSSDSKISQIEWLFRKTIFFKQILILNNSFLKTLCLSRFENCPSFVSLKISTILEALLTFELEFSLPFTNKPSVFLLGVHVINFIKGLLPDDWFDWFLAIWVIKVLIQSVTSKQVTLFCFKEKKYIFEFDKPKLFECFTI